VTFETITIDPLAIQITSAAAVGVVAVLVVFVLLSQRRATQRLQAIEAARAADQSALLLQQQIEALRDQFTRSLEANTHAVNQQLGQMSANVGQRLHESFELTQQTHRALGERMDHTSQVVGAVQRSLGTLEESNRQIYEIGKDISSLQEILRAPALRGGLGELLLEDLLGQILPAEHVEVQYAFRGGQKVDAVIRLGAGMVPVDAKFPLENFRRLLDAPTDEEKSRARKLFIIDVKRHIDAVASKYILPDEGTFDFALMYIPAENVYYEIVVKEDVAADGHIADYALARKVIPVSPGSFYAYLQAIVMGLRGLRIEERSKEILQQLARLRVDFDRFADDFRLVGKHLNNATSSLASADRRLERLGTRFSAVIGDDERERIENGEATSLFPALVEGNKRR
jgi:DNA recombination protein RmuC